MSLILLMMAPTARISLGQEKSDEPTSQPTQQPKTRLAKRPIGDAYSLATCPVSGLKLDSKGTQVRFHYQGRELRFCCGGCRGKFKKDPAKYLKKIDAELIAQQIPSYPFDTCFVSDEPLDIEGKPYDIIHNNRLIRFCCRGCVRRSKDKRDEQIKKINAAVIAQQMADYPLKTCPVSGEALGGEMGKPVDFVHNNRLVRFCCRGCVKNFKEDPLKYLALLDAAYKANPAAPLAHTQKGGDADGAPPAGHEGHKHKH